MPDPARSAPRTLICGSLALDTIMVFPDRFARHILPGETHVLSVSFQIGEMRREWGGCAGNIAYNLKGLGGEPVVMATVGDDGGGYLERLAAQNVAADGVRVVPGTYTAQAFIITDLDDNQITAFHPGAMNESHRNRVGDVADIALGIVAPDGREGMRAHVREFAAARIPFIFDPGQGLPLFSGAELIEMVDCAEYVAVNDYEARLLAERTGLSIEAIAARVDALIVTRGGEGSRIYTDGAVLEIPAVKPPALVDPTGCGDAYRAGLLYGIGQRWDWEHTGRLASLLGSMKIASRGGQNHALGRNAVAAQYHERFGQALF
jgi:adenosine kinase